MLYQWKIFSKKKNKLERNESRAEKKMNQIEEDRKKRTHVGGKKEEARNTFMGFRCIRILLPHIHQIPFGRMVEIQFLFHLGLY